MLYMSMKLVTTNLEIVQALDFEVDQYLIKYLLGLYSTLFESESDSYLLHMTQKTCRVRSSVDQHYMF